MDTTKVIQGAMQLLVGVVLVALILLLVYFCKEYICFKASQKIKNIFIMIDQKMRYNIILRAMIESYYGITMTSALTMRDRWDWSTTASMVNSLATLVFLPYLIGYPIWIIKFLYRNKYALGDRDF